MPKICVSASCYLVIHRNMMMTEVVDVFIFYNPNPYAQRVGDCTVRAISKVIGEDWHTTYIKICLQGLLMGDMPDANVVWSAYLKENGYKRHIIPDSCPDCYTVEDFAREHPTGKYVLALNGHVVAVCNGNVYDTWDSRNEIPIYYWEESK